MLIKMLALALLTGGTALHAQNAATGSSLDHVVPYQIGDTNLNPGDSVTIDQIHGTADTVSAGNLYEIKGHYKLGSHPNASLAAFVTTSGKDPYDGRVPTMKVQSLKVDQGDGSFTLFLYVWSKGFPHLSFYPADGGNSFASVYFGTGDTLMKPHARSASAGTDRTSK